MPIVDRAEMALILGVDEVEFRKLELAGLPAVPGVETSPRYDTPPVVNWYIAYRLRLRLGH